MIICASRRTDIPAFHSEWLMNRLDAGYALVRNPIHRQTVYRVDLSRRNVDAMVFITKDPSPMIPRLKEIGAMGHMYLFQVTLTAYGRDLEPGVPFMADVADSFKEISDRIGPDRMLWRYDPIVLDDFHTVEWHRRKFSLICRELEGYTRRCVISFVSPYNKLGGRFRSISFDEQDALASAIGSVAAEHGILVDCCCARRDFSGYGIGNGACIDRMDLKHLDIPFEELDTPLRDGCRCVRNIDIGAYDTCLHNCAYCYANASGGNRRSLRMYDPEAEMLWGEVGPDDRVVDLRSRKESRLSDYFDRSR